MTTTYPLGVAASAPVPLSGSAPWLRMRAPLCAGLLAASAAKAAAQPADWLPATDDAGTAPAATRPSRSDWRMRLEAGGDFGDRLRQANMAVDAAGSQALSAGATAFVSARLDFDHLSAKGHGTDLWLLSLREAYLRLASENAWLEMGRINLRPGVALGYNPSDFYREGALLAPRTQDPQRQRESRLGAVQLRAGTTGAAGDFAISASPALDAPQDSSWYAPRWGAVNDGRSQIGLQWTLPRWRGLFTQWLWQRRGDGRVSQGLNANIGLGNAWVVHAEWAASSRTPWLALERQDGTGERRVQQWALGATLSTAAYMQWGLEWQRNGAGLSAPEWRGPWQQADDAGTVRVREAAARQGDPLGRDGLMLSLRIERAGLRDADLGCLWRLDMGDRSQMQWCEWRLKQEASEWSLSLTHFQGAERSAYGASSPGWAMALRWRLHL
jgi:hypothetical protein